jgi:UTP-glucose-1-phosphate uridylyltransferase
MHIRKAVITAAGPGQRTLPLQTLVDRDGRPKTVLDILIAEVVSAGAEEVAVVVAPGDEAHYAQAVGQHAARLAFLPQAEPLGYGHAVYCARDFVGPEPFLHLVGDHLYVSGAERGCARRLVEVAQAEDCAVSAVQATRESLLPYYGAVAGRRVPGRDLPAVSMSDKRRYGSVEWPTVSDTAETPIRNCPGGAGWTGGRPSLKPGLATESSAGQGRERIFAGVPFTCTANV